MIILGFFGHDDLLVGGSFETPGWHFLSNFVRGLNIILIITHLHEKEPQQCACDSRSLIRGLGSSKGKIGIKEMGSQSQGPPTGVSLVRVRSGFGLVCVCVWFGLVCFLFFGSRGGKGLRVRIEKCLIFNI